MIKYEIRNLIERRESTYKIIFEGKNLHEDLRMILNNYLERSPLIGSFILKLPDDSVQEKEKLKKYILDSQTLINTYLNFKDGRYVETVAILTKIQPKEFKKVKTRIKTKNQLEECVREILFYELGISK